MKYRRKPITLEAAQWRSSCPHCNSPAHAHRWIDTLEGGHIVCPGDWIITGVAGDHYPCKSAIFAATYEPAGLDGSESKTEEGGFVLTSDGKPTAACRVRVTAPKTEEVK